MSGELPRVVVVSDQFPPMKGGIGDYTALLVDALVGKGVAVSLVVPSGADHARSLAPIAATYDRWSWAAARVVYRTLVATRADWVHLQHNGGMYRTSRLAAYFLPRYLHWKRWQGRIAVTFHDINRPPLFPRAGVLRDWVVGDLARRADAVIAADTADVETLRAWRAPVRQVPIGANIPTAELSKAEVTRVRAKYGIPEESLLVGHFGTALGLDTLFEAIARLPRAVLLLVGKADVPGHPGAIDILSPAMHARLTQLGIRSRVRWTCHLPEHAVADALAACDIIALPYSTGASMRHGGLLASLAQGRPVVTTTASRIMPGFSPGHTFSTVPPGDVESLAACISRVATDPVLRDRLANGAIRARELFSWRRIASEHVRVYRGEPPSPGEPGDTAPTSDVSLQQSCITL